MITGIDHADSVAPASKCRRVLCVGFGSALQNDRAPPPRKENSPGKATTEEERERRHLEASVARFMPAQDAKDKRPERREKETKF